MISSRLWRRAVSTRSDPPATIFWLGTRCPSSFFLAAKNPTNRIEGPSSLSDFSTAAASAPVPSTSVRRTNIGAMPLSVASPRIATSVTKASGTTSRSASFQASPCGMMLNIAHATGTASMTESTMRAVVCAIVRPGLRW